MAYHNVISCHTTKSSCRIMICSSFLPSSSIPISASMSPSCPCIPVKYLSAFSCEIYFFFYPAPPLVTSSSPYMLSKADDSENVPCFCQFCSIQSSVTQYMSFWISSYYLVISPWWKPLNFLNFFFLLCTVNSTILPSVIWEFCVILSPYSALLVMVSCTT